MTKRKPLFTLFISLIAITFTVIAPIFDTSVYAFNGSPIKWMSFNPEIPFSHMGVAILTSPFIHLNLEHLFVNIFFLTPIMMMIERFKSGKYLILTFLTIHLQVLSLLTLIAFLFDIEAKSFLGSSHIVIGMYCFWFLHRGNYRSFLITLLILSFGFWQSQSPFTILAHTLGVISGLLLYFFLKIPLMARTEP